MNEPNRTHWWLFAGAVSEILAAVFALVRDFDMQNITLARIDRLWAAKMKRPIAPALARFYGIIMRMHFLDSKHNPPHVHAIC